MKYKAETIKQKPKSCSNNLLACNNFRLFYGLPDNFVATVAMDRLIPGEECALHMHCIASEYKKHKNNFLSAERPPRVF